MEGGLGAVDTKRPVAVGSERVLRRVGQVRCTRPRLVGVLDIYVSASKTGRPVLLGIRIATSLSSAKVAFYLRSIKINLANPVLTFVTRRFRVVSTTGGTANGSGNQAGTAAEA